jgi:hypothetical protein
MKSFAGRTIFRHFSGSEQPPIGSPIAFIITSVCAIQLGAPASIRGSELNDQEPKDGQSARFVDSFVLQAVADEIID